MTTNQTLTDREKLEAWVGQVPANILEFFATSAITVSKVEQKKGMLHVKVNMLDQHDMADITDMGKLGLKGLVLAASARNEFTLLFDVGLKKEAPSSMSERPTIYARTTTSIMITPGKLLHSFSPAGEFRKQSQSMTCDANQAAYLKTKGNRVFLVDIVMINQSVVRGIVFAQTGSLVDNYFGWIFFAADALEVNAFIHTNAFEFDCSHGDSVELLNQYPETYRALSDASALIIV